MLVVHEHGVHPERYGIFHKFEGRKPKPLGLGGMPSKPSSSKSSNIMQNVIDGKR